MNKKIVIEYEETITETRVVVPGNIHCPACGTIVSLARSGENLSNFERAPWIETVLISPENTKVLSDKKDRE